MFRPPHYPLVWVFPKQKKTWKKIKYFVYKVAPQELGDNVKEEGFFGLEESKRLYKDLGI